MKIVLLATLALGALSACATKLTVKDYRGVTGPADELQAECERAAFATRERAGFDGFTDSVLALDQTYNKAFDQCMADKGYEKR